MMKIRKYIEIKGIVQGVGFRPFVYKIALENHLKGWVNNTSEGVFIDIEGKKKDINNFVNQLYKDNPPLSKIEKIIIKDKKNKNYIDFKIETSNRTEKVRTYISPDFSVCEDCIEEIFNPSNRRFKYPFTNCTNCGPRFSIIKSLPYDRHTTTMKKFEMCTDCKKEYEDPLNRRFHAQPNACHKCGPKVTLLDNKGVILDTSNSIEETKKLLKKGSIIAIKGIGGFNIACNCKDYNSILRLRDKKRRPQKPLAIMVRDIDSVKKYCKLDKYQIDILKSNRRPILLLDKLDANSLPEIIAPNNKKIGVMLPYTPLHCLLFDDELDSIVMTSANISGEPMLYNNNDAINKLNKVVDYFLINDRDIFMPIDDSVTTIINNSETIIRPGRGYAPMAINRGTKKEILALGSELKNTIAISDKENIYISGYIGDLKNTKTLDHFENTINHFKKIYNINPKVVSRDLHPNFIYKDYINSNKIKEIYIQHHHSHIASCLGDNNLNETVIGIAFDGTGYGDDGKVWGGEFLLCDLKEYKRVGHFEYFKLPGGDSAVIEPWKIAISLLYKSLNIDYDKILPIYLKDKNHKIIYKMLENNINLVDTSSLGRLFDGISALLGFTRKITFEGEAAIRLENLCVENEDRYYEFSYENEEKFIISIDKIICGVVKDIAKNDSVNIIATKFHNTIIKATIKVTCEIRKKYNINSVALSGGVFQNEFLSNGIIKELNNEEFKVYTHKNIPCNDSGISYGQLIISNEILND